MTKTTNMLWSFVFVPFIIDNFFLKKSETAHMCTYAKILISEKMKLILVVVFTQTLHSPRGMSETPLLSYACGRRKHKVLFPRHNKA